MEDREKKLIDRGRKGDLEAFGGLVEIYQRQVYTLACRFLNDREEAADVAQEAFMKAYQSLPGFRGDCSFKSWLYRITSNLCRDELRRRQRRPLDYLEEPFRNEEGEVYIQTPSSDPTPEELLARKESGEYLQKLIGRLAPEFRMVVVMREFQELTYEEMALELGCSLGTVKSRLSRARKALRQMILEDGELLAPASRL